MLRGDSLDRPGLVVPGWRSAARTPSAVAEARATGLIDARGDQIAESHVRDHDLLGWFDDEHPAYSVAKRTLDIVGATVLIVVLLPVLLTITILLLMEGTQPVLFHQRRIGRGARPFLMLKFRTMQSDRRQRRQSIDFEDRRRRLKVARDPRITPVGAFLRQTSLDELPQLLNILLGDMSLVGPRPELLDMLRYYTDAAHYARHQVTPGLTGWWQVNARVNRQDEVDPVDDLEEKARDDAYYVAHRSFALDLQILLKTVLVVLGRRGAV